jgi:quercetin dioxygenase-like cupin family protein
MAKMKDKKVVYRIQDLPVTNLTKESMARLILGDNLLVSFIENPPGTRFPLHSHDAEQIMIVLEGKEEHIVGGKTFFMEAGDVCVHPANVEHGGFTKTGFKGIDIFAPPRDSHVELMKKQGLLED